MARKMAMAEKEGGAWGTLEELVLACAVIRYGTESWDSIATEVQKCATLRNGSSQRSDDSSEERSSFLEAFTPRNCERRYRSLKRRFNVTGGGERNDTPAGDDENDGEGGQPEKLPFLVDELRKLRVEELRREVERRDDSIVSLQLKVRRLEGERRKSSTKAEPANGEADLETGADRNDAGVERRGREPVGSSTEAAVPGERFDEPQDRSFNGSNSSSHKEAPSQGRESNRRRKPVENRKNEPVLVRPKRKSEPDRNCSTSQGAGPDGGSGVVGKAAKRKSQAVRLGDLRESTSESKREAKQSSDVQSSASLSRRQQQDRRRSDGVGSSGEDMAEEISPANKKVDVKSQPLAKFLEILWSHKHGSVFHRRLPSQETKKYRNLIRQHMDLETVRSKLERGSYCDCHPKFYRDILLIFTNATTFFPKSSAEHAAARELRHLVKRGLTAHLAARKPKPTPTVEPEPKPRTPDSVVGQPKSSANIVVCRRRTMKKGDGGKGELKKESSDVDEEEPINERRKQLALSKKEGAANFLKRIKQPSPNEKEKPKKTEVGKKVVAGKKQEGKAGGGEDDGTAKRGSGEGEELVRPEKVKRAVRPPAVKAAAGAPPPDSGRAKRRREVEESSRSEKKKPKRKATARTGTEAATTNDGMAPENVRLGGNRGSSGCSCVN